MSANLIPFPGSGQAVIATRPGKVVVTYSDGAEHAFDAVVARKFANALLKHARRAERMQTKVERKPLRLVPRRIP